MTAGRYVKKRLLGCLAVMASLAADAAHAQFGVPWRHMPRVTVVSSAGDPRVRLVDEAVSFWNKTLEEVGSGFRIGPTTHVGQGGPEAALQAISLSGVATPG